MRAAFERLAGNACRGVGIVAALFAAAVWVCESAAPSRVFVCGGRQEHTNRTSIPRHCRSCRKGHIRWAGRCGQGTSTPTRRQIDSPRETLLASSWRVSSHPARAHRPRRTRRLPGHRAPRIPTQPRSAKTCRPSLRKQPRPDRQRVPPDGPRSPLIELRGPYGRRQLAPNLNCHHCDQSRRSTGPRGLAKINEPALSISGSAPG